VFGCLKQVGYKFGRWLDVVYMELVLDAAKKKLKRRKLKSDANCANYHELIPWFGTKQNWRKSVKWASNHLGFRFPSSHRDQ